MADIVLRFQKLTNKDADFDAPIPVSVHFAGQDTESFEFRPPMEDKALGEIRWYLERYWQWPTDIDKDRARKVEGALPQWGKSLFEAVFDKDAKAMRLFADFLHARDDHNTLTIDTTEPRILRLPWELLRDEGGYLFSQRVSIRRRMRQTRAVKADGFTAPMRVLLVSCRPEGAGFIDPRSIAGPLLDALETTPNVEVEFLRPPTLKALDARLRDTTQPRVHIVHFDGHGVYSQPVGLGLLLFEDAEHKEHLVDAEVLGTLLNESGIPLMVLNACQSAQPDERNPFASVAARLIESGMGGVVAMNYSVLVETAKRLTGAFYAQIARGQTVAAALDEARRALLADDKRTIRLSAHRDPEVIQLQDWFLPALYQQAEELRPLQPSTTPAPTKAPAPRPQDDTLYGFKGRARELLELERAFARRDIVLVHGFGGQGKTALARHAQAWFTRAKRFARTAFISFEQGASFEATVNLLGNALVEENFQIYAGDKVAAIAEAVRATPTLVVWDNFESVLPGGNAPLPVDELQMLLDAGARWFTGGSALMVTTRNPTVPHPAFGPGQRCLHKELAGLDPSDALDLAAAILDAHSLPRPAREPLEKLLRFLKHHPLSLQLALPHLRQHSPDELLTQFTALLPSITVGEGVERNQSLLVSLRFSLDRLGEEAQNWLARLAIFEGGAWEPMLLNITEIPPDAWHALKPQLLATALIRSEELDGWTVPYIHFHPTLAPYLRSLPKSPSPIQEEGTGMGVETRYWQAYYSLANEFYSNDKHNPISIRALVLRELPNLRRALRLCLAADALDEAVNFADSINRFLDVFGRWRERDEVAGMVEQAVSSKHAKRSVNSGGITQAQFMMESGRGERLLQAGRAAEAEQAFRVLLARLEGGAAYDSHYDQALVLGNIGRCLSAQGRPTAAAEQYRKALALLATLDQQDKTVRHQIAALHTDFANVLTDMGQYVAAKQEYEAALVIERELSDQRGEATDLGQLGTLALAQGDLKEARARYTEALQTFRAMGEQQTEAIVWHQLGRVAEGAREWEEAERCYKESLTLKESLGDLAGAAGTINHLASVVESAGRLEEGEKWARRALKLSEHSGNPVELAKGNHKLANSLRRLGRLDEAATYIEKAIQFYETVQDIENTVRAYNVAAQIAEQRGQAAEAREWRRKEQETFAAFAGSDTQIKQYEPLIQAIVAACQGNQQALVQLEPILKNMEADDDVNRAFARSARRVLAGERDFEKLSEGLAGVTALIIRRVLQALAGEGVAPSPAPAPPAQEPQGMSLEQLLGLVEQAAGGDRQLGEHLFGLFKDMRSDMNQPQEIRALGDVLLKVLLGDRNPDVSQLSEELASMVRGLLGRLRHG